MGLYRKYIHKPTEVRARKMPHPFVVYTLEGPMKGNVGDYKVYGENNMSWVVRGDIFEKTYMPKGEYTTHYLKEID